MIYIFKNFQILTRLVKEYQYLNYIQFVLITSDLKITWFWLIPSQQENLPCYIIIDLSFLCKLIRVICGIYSISKYIFIFYTSLYIALENSYTHF